MGRYTLNNNDDDDDSDNSESAEQYANQWDDGDVVMQDAPHTDEQDDDDDHHDEQTSPRPNQSLWSRALTRRIPNQEEEQEEYSNYESQQQEDESSLSMRAGPSYSYQVMGRAENGDLVPFHYHVYNGHPPPSNRNNQSIFTSCGWLLISLMAVLAHICYWYGPSVPPPDDSHSTTTTNWQEFISQEAAVAWELMVRWAGIVQYVGYWCFEAMSRESIHFYQSRFSSNNPNHSMDTTTTNTIPDATTITTVLDCHAPWRWDTDKLKQQLQVVGQEVAIDKLGKILEEEWNFQDNEPTQPHRVGDTQQQQRQHPLLFYVIGGPAVGKKQLARSLARQFRGKDCYPSNTNHDDGSSSSSSFLLELNTNNNNIGEEKQHSDSGTENQYQLVWNHAMDHPNGSIVLWPLDESNRSKSQVIAFLQDLQKAAQAQQILSGTTFDKMILVMTSEIGNPTIHKVLRKYGRTTELPLLELESFLRYELMEAYNDDMKHHRHQEPLDNNDDDDDDSKVTTTLPRSPSSTSNLFSKVHILTMFPLDRQAMRTILLQRLQMEYSTANRKFHVPHDALEYLLNHGLDWNQWIHAKTEELLLEYCANGARAIDPLLIRISSSCSSSSSLVVLPYENNDDSESSSITTTLLLLDKNMGKFEMISCPTDSDTLDGCNIDCQFVL